MLIPLECPTCETFAEHEGATVMLNVCTDDRSRSRFQFTCPTCGPQCSVLFQPTFVALAALGATECPWTLAELEAEHAAEILEFSERLPDLLERILAEAS